MDRRMGRIRVRGARALLLFVLAVAVIDVAVVPARDVAAQDGRRVSLVLLSQTASVGPTDDRFGLRVVAHNDGAAAVGDLDVRLVLGTSFTRRTDYEEWLVPGTTTTAIFTTRVPFDGVIEPGGVRQFAMAVDPSTIPALTPSDSHVYPLQVQVRSAGVTVGTLNTSLVWIVRTPERPVSFSWWTEFDAPLPLDASGRLADPAFEAKIRPDGALAEQADALATLAAREVPIDLVVRPALLEQLVRMSDGYERTTGVVVDQDAGGARDAEALLATLSSAAGSDSVQVSAMPFAGPSIPALLAGGLQADLEAQRQLGNAWTDDALGVSPADTVAVARPPGGLVSDDALAWFAGKGTRTILADADAVDRPVQENEFALPSTATVATSRGDVTLVLPDPGAQALLEREDLLADPVRAAQAVYAELAVIWRESPVPPDQPDGTPTQRGLALQVPTSMPDRMWSQLAGRLGSAPFLDPVHAQDHVAAVHPPGEPAQLRDPSAHVFSEDYAGQIRRLRRDVAATDSMFAEPTAQPERLLRNLHVAESTTYLGDELAGQTWLDATAAATTQVFDSVTPQIQIFTLTSREGDIPLLMDDPGEVPIRVIVELSSSRLRFPDGSRREVELEPGRPQVITVPVETSGAGNHQIQVVVRAPSGRVVSDQTVEVRSTVLNVIALAVTGAAALVLLALWVRRWFRRRATT
jgi:hypothetical protein